MYVQGGSTARITSPNHVRTAILVRIAWLIHEKKKLTTDESAVVSPFVWNDTSVYDGPCVLVLAINHYTTLHYITLARLKHASSWFHVYPCVADNGLTRRDVTLRCIGAHHLTKLAISSQNLLQPPLGGGLRLGCILEPFFYRRSRHRCASVPRSCGARPRSAAAC